MTTISAPNSMVVTLSDFGDGDGYAAAMTGAILSYNRALTVVPGPHTIRPFSVTSAAYVLRTVVPAFPAGTTFVVVVDPGVGSNRGTLVGECESRLIVAPDNGTVTLMHGRFWRLAAELYSALRARAGSATFDGRDVFAPVGARLATGDADQVVGDPTSPVTIEWLNPVAPPSAPGRSVAGRIIHIDSFGNGITNIVRSETAPTYEMLAAYGDRTIPLVTTFSDVKSGESLAYWGSYGHLELASRENSAEKTLGLAIGDSVVLAAVDRSLPVDL